MSDYLQMVERKLAAVPPSGIASGFSLPPGLFGHQQALTSWFKASYFQQAVRNLATAHSKTEDLFSAA